MSPRPVFVLELRAEPRVTDTIRAMRRALKALLRQHGFRCIAIRERPAEATSPAPRGFDGDLGDVK
jgi:hypothetical protein